MGNSCGCLDTCGGNNFIWIILLLLLFCGCDNGMGIGGCGSDNSCIWIILLLILCCGCGNIGMCEAK